MTVLGCAESYDVAFHDRTGAVVATDALEPTRLEWGRTLDDTSQAVVTLPGDDPGCCGAIADIDPWCNDLSLYRDGQLVWQGPIVRITAAADQTVVTARDVTAWLSRRLIHTLLDYTAAGRGAADLSVIAEAIVRDALAVDDPDVLPYLMRLPAGITGERAYEPQAAYALDELKELARTGLDFTAIGRRILLFGERPLARLATLTDEHFAPAPTVIADGLAAVTRAVVHGQGVTAAAGGPGACGLLEHLAKEEQILDAASAQAEAEALVAAGYPTPLILEVPDGSQLAPDTPAGINDLVPGVTVPVAASDLCRPVTADLRLARLAVTFDEGDERVQVTLAPLGVETGLLSG